MLSFACTFFGGDKLDEMLDELAPWPKTTNNTGLQFSWVEITHLIILNQMVDKKWLQITMNLSLEMLRITHYK